MNMCKAMALVALSAMGLPATAALAGDFSDGRSATAARPEVLARAASRAGQWASAARLWRALTIADPVHGEAWAMLGEALVRLGQPADAVAALGRAEELLPAQPGVGLSRGRAELALGHGEAAVAAFAVAVTGSPMDPRGWTGLGVARDLLGQHAAAQEAYRRALAIDPLNAAARHNLALSAMLSASGVVAMAARDAP